MTEAAAALRDFLAALQALGPWGVVFFLWWDGKKEGKKWEDRAAVEARKWQEQFELSERRYESNVTLVKAYEAISSGYQEIVIFNTQKITTLTEHVDNNLFCPLNRKAIKQKEID